MKRSISIAVLLSVTFGCNTPEEVPGDPSLVHREAGQIRVINITGEPIAFQVGPIVTAIKVSTGESGNPVRLKPGEHRMTYGHADSLDRALSVSIADGKSTDVVFARDASGKMMTQTFVNAMDPGPDRPALYAVAFGSGQPDTLQLNLTESDTKAVSQGQATVVDAPHAQLVAQYGKKRVSHDLSLKGEGIWMGGFHSTGLDVKPFLVRLDHPMKAVGDAGASK